MQVQDLFKNARVIALDIETINVSKKNNVIIQFGFIEVVDGQLKRRSSALFGGGKSGEAALAKHGITDESRVGKPRFEEHAVKIAKFLSGAILLGHNALKFDVPIIDNVCRKVGEPIIGRADGIPVIDTLPLARQSIHSPSYTLGTICGMLGVPYGTHDAEGDAFNAWKVFIEFVKLQEPDSIDRYVSYYKPE